MDKMVTLPKTGVLIGALDGESRDALLSLGITRTYRARETIFARGEEGGSIFIIASGRVEISITGLNGRKSVLNHMGPGEVMGEVALFGAGLRTADAMAKSKVSGLAISRPDVTRFLHEHPEAAMAIIAELCSKVRNASEMFEMQSNVSARALMMGEKWGARGTDGALTLSQFSQSDLGELSGLARENVNRHIRAFCEEEIMRVDGRQMVILQRDLLAEWAQM